MPRAAAAAAAAATAAAGCTVTVEKVTQGSCPSSRFGCGPAAVSPNAMYTKRGCCGVFNCDNHTTHCCSTSHTATTHCACGPKPAPAAGGTFHVRAGAPAGGDGSAAAPFATLQRCVDVATHTTTPSACRVAPGAYAEAVRAVGDVDIVGEAQGTTILDGTAPVGGKWERHAGAIYKTTLPDGPLRAPAEQLFVDGEYVPQARWPDAGVATMLDAGRWATMKRGSRWGVVYDPALRNTSADWSGARVTMNLGTGEFTWVRSVGAFNASAATFHYPTALVGLIRPHSVHDEERLFENNKYFLSGALAALDTPGEWWLNTTDWTLYVWAPDGKSPEGRVSVKVRDTCLTATGAGAQMRVRNLTFRACTLSVEGQSFELSDLYLRYPTYDPAWARGQSKYMPPATVVDGSNASITRVRLSHTNNWGLLVIGGDHRISDSLIESTGWLGSLDFPPIKIGFTMPQPPKVAVGAGAGGGGLRLGAVGGSRNTVEHVTVRGFGNSGIVTSQLQNTVRFTHVEDGGLIGGDDACIHADNTPTDCNSANCTKHWHHNWVNNCREKCVRCDDGSEDCLIDSSVVFNCGMPLHNGAPSGILLKGWGHRVYANTVFNTSAGQGDLCAVTKFGENKDSEYFNIAARRIGTRNGPSLTGNGTVKFAGGLYTGWHNWTALRLEDPLRFAFAPGRDSPLCGAGVARPPSAGVARPPSADVGDVEVGRRRAPPDVGAYACAAPGGAAAWTPGCTFHPDCRPQRPPWPR